MIALGGCATTGPGAPRHEPQVSKFETDPPGASVFIDGGFVGVTPTGVMLPGRPEVSIRIEKPGYLFVEELLRRAPGTPSDAPDGVGWESLYPYTLNAKRN
ncbi:MAG: PEGA domain-containing protein [Planctomycetota bacterium]